MATPEIILVEVLEGILVVVGEAVIGAGRGVVEEAGAEVVAPAGVVEVVAIAGAVEVVAPAGVVEAAVADETESATTESKIIKRMIMAGSPPPLRSTRITTTPPGNGIRASIISSRPPRTRTL